MSDLKDSEIERLSHLFASGRMKHACEIARLLSRELTEQTPNVDPLPLALGSILMASKVAG